MEKIITIFFDSEENAFQASQAINKLSADRDIHVTELYVVSKNHEGEAEIKNAKNQVVPYTASGALAGSLIGMLGGPLGVLMGMTTGMFAGGIGDSIRRSQSAKFLKKASAAIPPGKTAIVANINEFWETPLNTTLKPFNAEINRLNVNEEIERFIVSEQKQIQEEIEAVKQQLEHATEEEKEKLHAKLAELHTKADALKKNVQEESETLKSKLSSWFENTKSTFVNWKGDLFDRFDDSKEDLIDDYEDLWEDYQELSEDIQSGLKLLSDGSEDAFKKLAEYIRNKVDALNKDIAELELAIEKLDDKTRSRWHTKVAELKGKKDELLTKSRKAFEKYKDQQERWLQETENKIKELES